MWIGRHCLSHEGIMWYDLWCLLRDVISGCVAISSLKITNIKSSFGMTLLIPSMGSINSLACETGRERMFAIYVAICFVACGLIVLLFLKLSLRHEIRWIYTVRKVERG